ncbi:MAG TPA: hypothetical protein VMW76_04345 [Bacteroidales bacterium]|nr:hypothetical protein [Bacteroidales bacterium]
MSEHYPYLLRYSTGFNYLAAIRDITGTILPDTGITVRLGIITDGAIPATVREAEYPVTQNAIGHILHLR